MASHSYVPALDGVRAVAVVAVLCFHGGVAWLPGGFLGVDAFFVLSGYLITSLLLAESRDRGRVDVVAFWGRRARRLLPALVTVVVVVVLAAPVLLPAGELRTLRADAWATLLYVNNWQLVLGGGDYFAMTAAPSPFEHTWSLAIEEQFYLVWPLVLVLLLRRRRPVRWILLVCLIGAAASTTALALLHDPMDPGRAYYGTDTRGASLLLGAALAAGVAHEAVVTSFRRRIWTRRALGGLALCAAGVLAWTWTRASGDDPALYRGALTASALAVAVLLAHIVLLDDGVTARVLAREPLPSLGRISYGVYLWHWPMFLALSSDRTGLDGSLLFLARCAATLGIAIVSYTLVEQPIRSGMVLRRPRWATVGAVAGVALCSLLVTAVLPAGAGDPETPVGTAWATGGLTDLTPDAAPRSSDTDDTVGSVRPATGTDDATPAVHVHRRRRGEPVLVDVFGDSLATSLVAHLPAHRSLRIRDRTLVGCGITLRAPYRYFDHTYPRVWRSCRPWVALWTAAIAHDDPDVVLILVGRWETMDRTLDGRWTRVGEPDFDAHLRARLRVAVAIAGSHGARVVLATQPYNRRGERADGSLFPEDDPARVDRWNRLVREVAAGYDDVLVAEFGRRVSPGRGFTWTAGGFQMRTDGVHLASEGVRHHVAPWLFEVLLDAARR